MALSSDELNFLIFRYLQESGFSHSAFTFGCESAVSSLAISGPDVPPGALVSFLQKGLQYLELESNLNEAGTDVDGDFRLLTPHDLLYKDVPELKRVVLARRAEARANDAAAASEKRASEKAAAMAAASGPAAGGDNDAGRNGDDNDAAAGDSGEPMAVDASQLTELRGHQQEVFICAWNPNQSLLASGSGDATARIWDLDKVSPSEDGTEQGVVLRHLAPSRAGNVQPSAASNSGGEKAKDVTTLDWNPTGTLLATGSYDGVARIWSASGSLVGTLAKHQGPIFSLKWNKRGDALLSGSVDRTAIVWDAASCTVKQSFEFHSAPTLDVDWRDDTMFATCSTDKTIHVCRLGLNRPLRTFTGHKDEVNAIKWDPSGRLLASCSDDKTAKVWDTDAGELLHDMREHKKEIYTLKWAPVAPLLATASFDATVKLWDVETGRCVRTLNQHRDAVYSVAFSPDGKLIASGSSPEGMLNIWEAQSGKLIKQYKGGGGIFDVSWDREGRRVAACFGEPKNVVAVVDMDVRM
ncbi:transducin [Pycnococcus provasolii]